jgi:hypothetical protein
MHFCADQLSLDSYIDELGECSSVNDFERWLSTSIATESLYLRTNILQLHATKVCSEKNSLEGYHAMSTEHVVNFVRNCVDESWEVEMGCVPGVGSRTEENLEKIGILKFTHILGIYFLCCDNRKERTSKNAIELFHSYLKKGNKYANMKHVVFVVLYAAFELLSFEEYNGFEDWENNTFEYVL